MTLAYDVQIDSTISHDGIAIRVDEIGRNGRTMIFTGTDGRVVKVAGDTPLECYSNRNNPRWPTK